MILIWLFSDVSGYLTPLYSDGINLWYKVIFFRKKWFLLFIFCWFGKFLFWFDLIDFLSESERKSFRFIVYFSHFCYINIFSIKFQMCLCYRLIEWNELSFIMCIICEIFQFQISFLKSISKIFLFCSICFHYIKLMSLLRNWGIWFPLLFMFLFQQFQTTDFIWSDTIPISSVVVLFSLFQYLKLKLKFFSFLQ